jgi:hypothetical protein
MNSCNQDVVHRGYEDQSKGYIQRHTDGLSSQPESNRLTIILTYPDVPTILFGIYIRSTV